MKRLSTDAEVLAAVDNPPTDTRAYFRGRCLQDYPDQVAAASWDSVIFDLPGHDSLQRIPTLDPMRGTHAHVGALMDRCSSAAELFAALTD
jgi:proteasome accessory factor A